MEKLTMYDYIKMRIGMNRRSIVQDLINDMKRDEALKGMTAQEIVEHIRHKACYGAWQAMRRFVSQYKRYCKLHELEAEEVTCKKQTGQ